ncbi:MAG: hypothetical protein HC896_10975 [Bacteroidales bacterium]|nr:hypothetical protein [Bacteroidales bacterium]
MPFTSILDSLEAWQGPDVNLVNGKLLHNKYRNANGHPYFGENAFSVGSIKINNAAYQNVLLKLDLLTNDVILQHPSHYLSNIELVLNKNTVEYFTLQNKKFVAKSHPKLEHVFYKKLPQAIFHATFIGLKTLRKS